MSRRYDFQDILDRFASTQNQRFRELSDAIARRILELLGGGTVPNDPPGAPSNLTASTNQEFRVFLDWDAVAGSTGYNVYRAPIGSTAFTLLSQASTSDYVDSGLPAETSYRYYVTAYNSAGESGPSSTEIGTTADGAAPPLPDVPANFQVLSNEDTVTLGWDAFTGGTISCRIERSVDQANWSQVANTAGVTFNDANVSIGATFYYRAFGISATGVSSVATPTLSVTVVDGDTEAPPVPVLTNTTLGNKSVFVEWDGVVAGDLAGYEIGYGTTSGVYTDTTDLITGTSANVGGLTNLTQYYFAVRSVDTSLNQNKSAWSNEQSKTPIQDLDPGLILPPEPPTALTVSSPDKDEIRVGFVPGVTATPRRHRLYARVKPGQLVNGSVPTEAWTQIDQVPNPGTVVGAGATIFTGIYSWYQNPVIWQFYVTCVDTYGDESGPSEIVESAVDGSDWAQGPGSGPISGGNFNGDNLTQEHKVPGYTFDFIIDVSDPAAYTGDAIERAAAIFNNRRNLAPTNPDYIQLSTTDKAKIAILLPSETVNRRLEINTGSAGNADIEAANFDFGGDPGFESLVELHLVGPWDAANATMVDAQIAMRDDPLNFTLGYKRTFKDEDNKSRFPDGAGNNITIGDVTRDNAKLDLWLWNWDIEVSGKSGVFVGSNADEGGDFGSHDFWVGLGLCRVHQDAILPNNAKIGSHAIDARYAKVAMGGTYIDMPWQDGSAVRCLSTLRGDFDITNCRVRRSGGSAFEYYTRNSRDVGLPEGTDPGTLSITGFRHWDETAGLDDGIGRASREGTYVFDFGGLEQDITIHDTHIIQENPANFRGLNQWPPADPYDWRIYTDAARMSHSAIRLYDRAGSRARYDGFKHGHLTITDSLFYSKYPRRAVLDVDTAKTVTLDDVGAWTGEAIELFSVDTQGVSESLGNSTLAGYRYGGAGVKPASAPSAIGAMSATGLNTTAQETEITSTYGIGAGFVADASAGILFGELLVDHFEVTADHSWLSFTPPGATYSQPANLQPFWPSVSNFSALNDMLGLTRRQAKDFIVPGMRALRTGRTPHSGGFSLQFWRVAPGEPQGVGIAVGGDPNFYELSTDRRTLTWKDGEHTTENISVNAQKYFIGHYSDRSQYDIVPLTSPGPSDDPDEARVVMRREYSVQPPGSAVVFENVSLFDDPSFWVAGGGSPNQHKLKWGTRMNAMQDFTVRDSDFGTVHNEHCIYVNPEGPILVENCTFSNTCGQGFQAAHRHEAQYDPALGSSQPTGENHMYSPAYPPTRTFRNCHFVDCGPYGRYRARSSSSLTLQDNGYPTLPSPFVLIEDCTFVAGIDADEPKANEGSSAIAQDGRYRYTFDQSSGNYSSTGELRVGIEGGYFRNKIHYSGVDMAPVAAGRADDSAALVQDLTIRNTYFHVRDNDKAILNLDSCRNITLEDVVIIQEYDFAIVAQPGVSVDSDLYKAQDERGTINHHLLGGQKLILRNCYGMVRDTRSGSLVESPLQIKVYDPQGGYVYLDVGDLRGQEVEYALFYADGQIRTNVQVNSPIYTGSVRVGHTPT